MATRGKKASFAIIPRLSDRQLGLLALLIAAFGAAHTLILLLSVPILPKEPLEFQNIFYSASKVTKGHRHHSSNSTIQLQLQQPTKNTNTNTTIRHHPAESLIAAIDHPLTDYAIPKILIFTHYRNLLADANSLEDAEEIVLSKNIQHAIALHPHSSTTTRFLTDDDCIASLQKVFPSLIPYFQNETQGMFKADICRGSALYETGGIYLDVDLGVRKDLWQDLSATTEFVTCLVHRQSKYPKHFFQAFLGAAPKSPIIYHYLQLFYNHYAHTTGGDRVDSGPLGVILMRRAWEQIYNVTSKSPTTELYQEVLYHKQLFPNLHPAPTWGTRRACHFVVVAPAHSAETTEVTWQDRHFQIPLYSRIAGSRMCPIHHAG